MKIEQRKIADIEPYEKNAKEHPDDQVQKIADSIKEFGFNQPIVVDKAGVIIVGHGRFLAAHLLGMDEVPVMELDLTEEQAMSYRLADNKLNESEWNMELVVEELKLLPEKLVELSGFGDVKLEERIGGSGEIEVEFLAQGMVECPKCHFQFDPKAQKIKHDSKKDGAEEPEE